MKVDNKDFWSGYMHFNFLTISEDDNEAVAITYKLLKHAQKLGLKIERLVALNTETGESLDRH